MRTHPDVLELRWQVYAKTKNWLACIGIGKALSTAAPQRSSSWIHWAYSLHELKRTTEACDVLFPIASKFPMETTILYNLACYRKNGQQGKGVKTYSNIMSFGLTSGVDAEYQDILTVTFKSNLVSKSAGTF